MASLGPTFGLVVPANRGPTFRLWDIGPVLFHWSGHSDPIWPFFFTDQPGQTNWPAFFITGQNGWTGPTVARPLSPTILPRPLPALFTFTKMLSEGDVQVQWLLIGAFMRKWRNIFICVIFVCFSSSVDVVKLSVPLAMQLNNAVFHIFQSVVHVSFFSITDWIYTERY